MCLPTSFPEDAHQPGRRRQEELHRPDRRPSARDHHPGQAPEAPRAATAVLPSQEASAREVREKRNAGGYHPYLISGDF